MAIHATLASGRWQTLTLMEQMGNIGSEVGRALSEHAAGDEEGWKASFTRAIELFDLTIDDPRWRGRLREILRAREVFCDFFYGDNQYHSEPKKLDTYFMDFAMAARLHR